MDHYSTNDFEPRRNKHSMIIRVYYEDTDFSGVVYHASYLRFLERGRTELLRTIGINQGQSFRLPVNQSYGFVVSRLAIKFLSPAKMDDLIEVETSVNSIGGASVELDQRIVRDTRPLASAKIRIALVSEGKVGRLPPELRQRLSRLQN